MLPLVLEAGRHESEIACVKLEVAVLVASSGTERAAGPKGEDGLGRKVGVSVPVTSGPSVPVRLKGHHSEVDAQLFGEGVENRVEPRDVEVTGRSTVPHWVDKGPPYGVQEKIMVGPPPSEDDHWVWCYPAYSSHSMPVM